MPGITFSLLFGQVMSGLCGEGRLERITRREGSSQEISNAGVIPTDELEATPSPPQSAPAP